jgi:anti-sigma factor RsiW
MNHAEAVEKMTTEKYLLGELSPEIRDAFEEHFFDCAECAMDVRAAAVFLDEAKEQLPELTGPLATPAAERPVLAPAKAKNTAKKDPWWSALLRPALAMPVFAVLIAIVGYQNIVMLPALRSAASEPQLAPTVYLHSGTRGMEAPLEVDAKHGIVLTVDRPQQAGFTSFEFALMNPEGKQVASLTAPAEDGSAGHADGTLSLAIPGARLSNGAYTLAISGVTSAGSRSEIERHSLDIRLKQ